jgi:hypothetical protein
MKNWIDNILITSSSIFGFISFPPVISSPRKSSLLGSVRLAKRFSIWNGSDQKHKSKSSNSDEVQWYLLTDWFSILRLSQRLKLEICLRKETGFKNFNNATKELKQRSWKRRLLECNRSVQNFFFPPRILVTVTMTISTVSSNNL